MAYIPGERGTSGEPGCTIAEKSEFFGFSRSILKCVSSLRVGYPLWGRGTSGNFQVPQSWRCWTLVISQKKTFSIPHLSNLQILSTFLWSCFQSKNIMEISFRNVWFRLSQKVPRGTFWTFGELFLQQFWNIFTPLKFGVYNENRDLVESKMASPNHWRKIRVVQCFSVWKLKPNS